MQNGGVEAGRGLTTVSAAKQNLARLMLVYTLGHNEEESLDIMV